MKNKKQNKEKKYIDVRNAIMKALQKENEKLRTELNNIFNDFNISDSRKDIWERINNLIGNELKQEEMCGE